MVDSSSNNLYSSSLYTQYWYPKGLFLFGDLSYNSSRLGICPVKWGKSANFKFKANLAGSESRYFYLYSSLALGICLRIFLLIIVSSIYSFDKKFKS